MALYIVKLVDHRNSTSAETLGVSNSISGVAARPLDAHRAMLLLAASVLTVGSSSRRQQASSPSRWLERNCLENAIPTGDDDSNPSPSAGSPWRT
jgi:hypothetical protein